MPAPAATDPVAQLRAAVTDAAGELRAAAGAEDGGGARPALERPPKAELGDYSTNAAMLLAPVLGEAPREIAGRLGERVREALAGQVARVEVAGPGFVNVWLDDAWYREALGQVLAAGERFGAGAPERPERVQVEFVSANPTGPLHVGGARGAAYGDSLARLLELAGHEVQREFYVNDHGSQVRLFGESIAARMRQAHGEGAGLPHGDAGAERFRGEHDLPEGGYEGEYVIELARALEGADPDDAEAIGQRGVELVLGQIEQTLRRFRVHFDAWFHERSLHQGPDDAVARALDLLAQHDRTYESEGALWLRTTAFGDDKDRVLVRSSGERTYFASDIAYHEDKRERGFDRVIDVWGADHHGYVKRMKAAFAALGGDPDRLELIIMQLVNVVERGERAKMSKRTGEFVTLDELIEDIGTDAARFFLLQRSIDSVIDLDLALAREQSQENPVYYVQYAHARIASLLRKAGGETVARAPAAPAAGRGVALEPAERALVRRLLELPEQVREAAERRAPHRFTAYGQEVAADFHAFYRDCQVVGAEPQGVEDFRIALCLATRAVVRRSLDLLGVEAPERM